MIETQFFKRIKTFRSDNTLKYTQYAFQALLHSYGTVHHLTQFPYVCGTTTLGINVNVYCVLLWALGPIALLV